MSDRAHRYVGWLLALGAAGGFGEDLGAQAPTTRLEGLVLDPLSQPVANARITVEIDGDVVARTQTDGLGTFVAGKVPAQMVVVRATTEVPDERGGGYFYESTTLSPGEALTCQVCLRHYVEVLVPGTYHLRFAYREDADQLVDAERNELVRGLLFLYSEPFTLVVGEG